MNVNINKIMKIPKVDKKRCETGPIYVELVLLKKYVPEADVPLNFLPSKHAVLLPTLSHLYCILNEITS